MKFKFVLALACIGVLLSTFNQATSLEAELQTESPSAAGGIATLWCLDGRANSLSLNTGEPGAIKVGNTVFNRDSQIDFGSYHSGRFTVGIQGGEMGRIVDLGTE